ncbi:hypothetical protein HNQ91_006030 [Filimonas zeae]|uniref:DUF3037 domain-containing protein n=1 Tax=Filimonas zeae TaxID=1737353 RepID=A0A917MZF2_9BACT|nr:DUF3037 domain-containing protein [Filimonas zeae]MDR6342943.1 hypothetical protein [Filimonas zeae]GGH83324.1 hypothetical protein GCM10011379_58540 [Filimonas zeae]
MQEKHLYEYAILRVVPRVEREEFMNVGVVLLCARQRFLKVLYRLDEQRLLALCPQLDIAELQTYLQAFERICAGAPGSGTIGKFTIAERFRWLTATRSTVLQSSKVHPGFCSQPELMLERLFAQQVL